jgi:hypothetical protein
MASAERAPAMIEDALAYLRRGLPIFPVCSPLMGAHKHYIDGALRDCTGDRVGKNPMVSWKAFQSELPSVQQVRSWWTRWPVANIGMATGRLAGIIVLDCDSGEARQLALDRGGLDDTPSVWTGTPGGVHFWMRHPGYDVKNFVKEIAGTDFRGDGGYVLLPPSRHWRGATYRWVEGTESRQPAPVPPWLDRLFQEKTAGSGNGPEGEPFDLTEILEGIGQGARDTTLYSFAGKLRADNVPLDYAELLVRQAARLCRPAFDEELAVEKVRRAYKTYRPNDHEGFAGLLEDEGTDEGEEEAEGGSARTWTVYDIADFLAIEYPPIAWRVEGFLRDRAIMFSYGAPGSLKTYVATDAGLSLASGGLFLGKFPCNRGRVLVVQEDTLASDYQQAYLLPMMKARGLTADELRGWFFVAPQDEFSLDRNDRLHDLCDWLEEHRPDLLILDSFYLMYSGRKEDLLQVLKIIRKIRDKYGCAVWIIDHNRKGQGDNSGENPIDRLINGREKSAMVDTVMESRPVKGQGGSTFLDVLKLRGVKLPEPVRVTYDEGRFTIDGKEADSPKGAAQTIYEWLCREGGSRTVRQIIAGTGLADRTVRGGVAELYQAGLARPFEGFGKAKTWLAIRRADAEPAADGSFDFDEDEG